MATKAIYQHHERTTTAAVEGDLQLREVGIDPQTKMLIARSENLSAFLHFIAKETINPVLDSNLTVSGTLGVTGATTLSSTLGVTGASTLAALSATTGAFSSNATVGGTLGVTGVQSNSEAIVLSGDGTGGAGRLFNSTTNGMVLRANTGSAYDFYLFSAANNSLIRNPTGGSTLEFPGTGISVGGTLTLSTISSGRIPVVSTAGLVTQDNLYWDATNDRLGVGSGASTPTADITLIKATVGAGVQLTIYNSDNTNTASEGRLVIASGGSGAGDAYITLSNQVVDWSIGLDNSNSDSLVISEANVLGSSDRLRIDSGGAVVISGTITTTTTATGKVASFSGGSASTDDAYAEITAPDRAYLNLYASYNDYNGIIGFDGSNSTLNLVTGANTWGSNGIAIGASSVNIYENLAGTKGFRLDSRSLVSSAYSTNNASPSSFDVSEYTYLDYNVNTASSTYVETTNEYNGSILFVWNRNASTGVLYIRGATGEAYVQVDVGYKAILIYHSSYSGWIRFSHQA